MLTLAGRITKGLTDRRSAPTVLLKSPRSPQTELTNHRSGDLGTGEPVAVLRRTHEVSYFVLCGGRIGHPSGKCRFRRSMDDVYSERTIVLVAYLRFWTGPDCECSYGTRVDRFDWPVLRGAFNGA
jgi:hypothetical protein